MTTATLTGTLLDAAGSPEAGRLVRVSLAPASTSGSTVIGGIIDAASVRTDDLGFFAIDLVLNTEVLPDNTYYAVHPAGTRSHWHIRLTGAGVFDIDDPAIQVEPASAGALTLPGATGPAGPAGPAGPPGSGGEAAPDVEVLSHDHVVGATFTPETDITGWDDLESADMILVFSTQVADPGAWLEPGWATALLGSPGTAAMAVAQAYRATIDGAISVGFATATKYDILVIRGSVVSQLRNYSAGLAPDLPDLPVYHDYVIPPVYQAPGSKVLAFRSSYSGDDAIDSVTIDGTSATGSVLFHSGDLICGLYDLGPVQGGPRNVLSLPNTSAAPVVLGGSMLLVAAPTQPALPLLPDSGATGDVLTKSSTASFDASWATPSAPPRAKLNVTYADAGITVHYFSTSYAAAELTTEITLAAGEYFSVATASNHAPVYLYMEVRRVRDSAGAMVAGSIDVFQNTSPADVSPLEFASHGGAGVDVEGEGGGAGPWTSFVALTGGTYVVACEVSWA